jgi:hypothetical protein
MSTMSETVVSGIMSIGSWEALKKVFTAVQKKPDDSRMVTVSKLFELIEELPEPELKIIDQYLDLRLREKANKDRLKV